MLEMRRGKDLKYSNQLPRWALNAHVVIIALLGLLGVAGILFGVYMLCVDKEWFLGALALVIGAFILAVTFIIGRINTFYTDFIFQNELRDDGYYLYAKNKKTGAEEERLISYEQMEEVLIGRMTRAVPRGENMPSVQILGARIVMRWKDEQGQVQYTLFGEENREPLKNWIEKFQEHGVPLRLTHQNIGALRVEQLREAYAEIDKRPYGEEGMHFLNGIGTSTTPIAHWRSSAMKSESIENQKRRDRVFFRPLWLMLLAANVVVAALWMPHWTVEDGTFADSSPSFNWGAVNVLLLPIARTYWRERFKWHRPARDLLFVLGAQLAGIGLAVVGGYADSSYIEPVIIENIVLGIFTGVLVLLLRFIRLRSIGR